MTKSPTGRLPNYQPNLQNIPIRTKEWARIREAFIDNVVTPEEMKPGKIYRSSQNDRMTYRRVKGVLICVETGRTFPEFKARIFKEIK